MVCRVVWYRYWYWCLVSVQAPDRVCKILVSAIVVGVLFVSVQGWTRRVTTSFRLRNRAGALAHPMDPCGRKPSLGPAFGQLVFDDIGGHLNIRNDIFPAQFGSKILLKTSWPDSEPPNRDVASMHHTLPWYAPLLP